ncbi:hypothetical protein EVAR_9099_1 [Eumeta japonica]|uniref:Uncharacterized protein n=1 Tax=Eumeta variegata TaxID=151549 RepID=A0A4C1TX92_EUMVA|nr:hypothetical protein EVAR_9099_1 [Eumeta japonica]
MPAALTLKFSRQCQRAFSAVAVMARLIHSAVPRIVREDVPTRCDIKRLAVSQRDVCDGDERGFGIPMCFVMVNLTATRKCVDLCVRASVPISLHRPTPPPSNSLSSDILFLPKRADNALVIPLGSLVFMGDDDLSGDRRP